MKYLLLIAVAYFAWLAYEEVKVLLTAHNRHAFVTTHFVKKQIYRFIIEILGVLGTIILLLIL